MDEPTCKFDGCDTPPRRAGWCGKHHQRIVRHRDPSTTSRVVGDDEARFWSHAERRSDDECWPWSGNKSFRTLDGSVLAREFAYTFFVGPVPAGYHVEHDLSAGCTGGNCVNWARHLRAAGLRCKWCGTEFPDPVTGRHHPRTYCSSECRRNGARCSGQEYRQRIPLETCEIEDCAELKRSRRSKWCEMHYGRWRRNGDPLVITVRRASDTCHHCGDPMPTARRNSLFCSELCRRRDRLDAPGKELTCVVCGAKLPEGKRLGSLLCPPDDPARRNSRCKRIYAKSKLYGLSLPQVRELLANSACAICGHEADDLFIDHCHTTGRVRAMLCPTCNSGLGMFKDSPELLRAAISYLADHGVIEGGDEWRMGEQQSPLTLADKLGLAAQGGS